MNDNGEISPSVQHVKMLRITREEIRNRTLTISERFKESLIVASNAVNSIRMVENLASLLEKKRAHNEDVNRLERQLHNVQNSLKEAVSRYDYTAILDVEGVIEQLTLSYDPIYLETEEIRKKEYRDQKKREARQKVTWAQNPSSRFVSLMKGDFEGAEAVTEAEQRSCISKCAWLFAIIGLLVALSFLVAEFWYAQVNPAVSTTFIRNNRLQVPMIHLCSQFPFIPSFDNLSKDHYAGETLFGLRSYTNIETEDRVLYPETKDLISEPSLLGNQEYCRTHMQYMSKRRIIKALLGELDYTETCYPCLSVGLKKPIHLNAATANQRSLGAVTVEAAISYDIEYCFNPSKAVSGWLRANLRSSIETHWTQLVKQGIIKLINPPDSDFVLKYGFDHLRRDPFARAAAENAVYCNIYFFSGYFFPVEPGTEVRYGYDAREEDPWVRLSDDDNFLATPTNVRNPYVQEETNRTAVLDAIKSNAKASSGLSQYIGVNLFVLNSGSDRPPTLHDYVTALRQNHRDVLLLTKENEHKKNKYIRRMLAGPMKLFVSIGRFARFNVSVDFATFDTALMTRRPTTSVPEFLTDVFEYIGLFTGICAYSLIVGPARMYLRRTKSET
ncbi:hypothetical protein BWQ96_02939 [Gracilariopsis chorda]|uniref:Uncharacterized protein n=1 Tax=Gracilariopsis chorda TaxID=448386 RepID=A0A2V3IYT9_9FLOR|nr:hypothetical protein BWQ96_02939 [Gracilariopsis chorda]|eukprot:PXF47326.1 hypothetical protein BWQ96_02939 [Gracilariopsis chorda]